MEQFVFTRVKSSKKAEFFNCGNNRGHKKAHKKTQSPINKIIAFYKCRGEWIRTTDLVVPNDAR